MAWLSLVIIFFLAMVLRRQCADGMLAGMGFNFVAALIMGLGLGVAIITFTGSSRWALLAGICGVAVGGFVIGIFLDQSGGVGDD